MQTFLPFPDYVACAKVLDNKRLGSQCKECKQIITALYAGEGAWRNHPATKMWEDYPYQLCIYMLAMCNEWSDRGNKIREEVSWLINHEFYAHAQLISEPKKPAWLGDERLHSSHRQALLVKNWKHYKHHFADMEGVKKTPLSAQYFWPSHCIKYGGKGSGYLEGKYVLPKPKETKTNCIIKVSF